MARTFKNEQPWAPDQLWDGNGIRFARKLGKPIGPPIRIDTQAYAARENATSTAQYFDYYFSGTDVKVYIEGAPNSQLSIVTMGFNVTQMKQPVYGFWSYTYDSVLVGQRIVQGQITLNYREENALVSEISRAIKNNQKRDYLEGLTSDDREKMRRYWGVSRLDRSLDPLTKRKLTKHLFVSHPPFNLVVVFGIQNDSLKNNPRKMELWNNFRKGQDFLSKDTNERLVDGGAVTRGRFALTGVQITSMDTQYSPDQPVVETYSFFARDISPVVR